VQLMPRIRQFIPYARRSKSNGLRLRELQLPDFPAMKKLYSAALAAFLLIGSSAFAQTSNEAGDARVAAERWMKLMDTEEYSAAWNAGSESMRKGLPKMGWNLLASTVHMPLGAFKGRTFKSSDMSTATADKPASVTLTYIGDYENSHNVLEKFTAVLEKDGQWRVSGFTINSDVGKNTK